MSNEWEDPHAIDGAVYDIASGFCRPTLYCACGYRASGDDWVEAGRNMDGHLASVELEGEQG